MIILLTLILSCCVSEFTEIGEMKLSSTAFKNGTRIPGVYTCDGREINPPLDFENVPQNAASLALVVEDPDAPSGTFYHWLVWNISPDSLGIEEDKVPAGAVQGLNTEKTNRYIGPCPPSGTHRYYFRLYALDTILKLPSDSDKKAFDAAIKGHVLAQAEYIGLYSR